jgi:hypothetical protein
MTGYQQIQYSLVDLHGLLLVIANDISVKEISNDNILFHGSNQVKGNVHYKIENGVYCCKIASVFLGCTIVLVNLNVSASSTNVGLNFS